MPSRDIDEELARALAQLSPELQHRVLEFANTLARQPCGVRGHELLRFAGTLEADDARAMTQAIDEACERVHPDEW